MIRTRSRHQQVPVEIGRGRDAGLTRRWWLAFAAGCGLVAFTAHSPIAAPVAAAEPDEALKGEIYLFTLQGAPSLNGIFAVNAADLSWRRVVEPELDAGRLLPGCRVSRDGRKLVYCTLSEGATRADAVWLLDLKGNAEPKRVADVVNGFSLSPDGSELLVAAECPNQPNRFETWRIGMDGQERKRLEIPEDELLLDGSDDGKWLLLTSFAKQPAAGRRQAGDGLIVRRADGSHPRTILEEGPMVTSRFSPDGTQVSFHRFSPAAPGQPIVGSIFVMSTDGTGLRTLVAGDQEHRPQGARWSPEGHWLVVDMLVLKSEEDNEPARNERQLQLFTSAGKFVRRLELPFAVAFPLDWRQDAGERTPQAPPSVRGLEREVPEKAR